MVKTIFAHDTAAPTMPSTSDPANFPTRADAALSYLTSGTELEVQDTATDTTAGRIPKMGNDADFASLTAGKIKIGTNTATTETDLALTQNAVINTEVSFSVGWEVGGYFRFLDAVTDVDGGTAGGTEVWKIDGSAMELNGVAMWAEEITIADDAVGTVDLPAGRYGVLTMIMCDSHVTGVQNAQSGILRLDAGSSPAVSPVDSGAQFTATTGTLTGTTGVDGKTTVAPNSSQQILIENRSGSSRTYQVVML